MFLLRTSNLLLVPAVYAKQVTIPYLGCKNQHLLCYVFKALSK